MIRNNQHKYSISAMCKVLQLPRSTYYYEAKVRVKEDDITSEVIDIFHASRQNYGTHKIKVELKNVIYSFQDDELGELCKSRALSLLTP